MICRGALPRAENPRGRREFAAWTARAGVRLRGFPDSERQRDVLDVCFAAEQRKCLSQTVLELTWDSWCDTSQSVERLLARRGGIGTLATCGQWYSYERDCVLSGAGQLCLLGWPSRFMPNEVFRDYECRLVAGDCFSVPIAAQRSFIYFMNRHTPWWKDPDRRPGVAAHAVG